MSCLEEWYNNSEVGFCKKLFLKKKKINVEITCLVKQESYVYQLADTFLQLIYITETGWLSLHSIPLWHLWVNICCITGKKNTKTKVVMQLKNYFFPLKKNKTSMQKKLFYYYLPHSFFCFCKTSFEKELTFVGHKKNWIFSVNPQAISLFIFCLSNYNSFSSLTESVISWGGGYYSFYVFFKSLTSGLVHVDLSFHSSRVKKWSNSCLILRLIKFVIFSP